MRGFNPRMLCLWMSYCDLMAQSVYVKCKLVVRSNFGLQIDESLEGVADACHQILFVECRLCLVTG